ncbi:unnamed protein product [Hydatigera taeniaeformis]|uniref:G_PROTEIN_RECEP_F1_2 domain-containing protein n=1 Tax=Hydatigena taeniaeformis TaxID=6205 RepID=A0A0R3WZY6_HYDTA|nr:unnamed protein product [Hydatigera taeniaeformis]
MDGYVSANELNTFIAPLVPFNNSDVFECNAALRLARIICTHTLMPIVCVVGMAGNVLNIVVLTSATMRSSTSYYLCALAVYDFLYSLTGLPLTLRTYPSLEMSSAYMNALTYLLPLGNMWSNITTWLTCAFTIERFVAISAPIRSRKISSIRRTQWNIVFISLLIAIITLPDFFGWKIREARRTCSNSAKRSNVKHNPMVPCVEMFYIFESTWISTQLDRFGWSYAIVALFVFIPLVVLTIFNALLIRSVIKSHNERKDILAGTAQINTKRRRKALPDAQPPPVRRELVWRKWWIATRYYQQNSFQRSAPSDRSPIETGSDRNTFTLPTSGGADETVGREFITTSDQHYYWFRCKNRDRKHNYEVAFRRSSHQDKQSITITLIAVVVVFCMLNAPSAVVCLIRPWFKPSDARIKAFGNISNLLLMLNASVNFILYSLFSASFRRSFRTLLKRCRC